MNDREFLKIMDSECYRDENGFWIVFFLFKIDWKRFFNNCELVMKRILLFLVFCKKNFLKMEYLIFFMEKVFFKGYVEIVLVFKNEEECWYFFIFGVYNFKKMN